MTSCWPRSPPTATGWSAGPASCCSRRWPRAGTGSTTCEPSSRRCGSRSPTALHRPDARLLLEPLRGFGAAERRVEEFGDDPTVEYREVVAASPRDEGAWLELGLALWDRGREDEAAEALGHVHGEIAQGLLGRYWFYRHDFARAFDAFQRAGDDYMAAWSLWGMGRYDPAVERMRASHDPRAAEDFRRMMADRRVTAKFR